MSTEDAGATVPPSSQSHFAKFQNFTPNDAASFDDEFARLAASQEWIPGSQLYSQKRTIAINAELKSHYFSSAQSPEEAELRGYQDLCGEVGLPRFDTTQECQTKLKKTLVNIVDLIDARRTMKKVKVWDSFAAFRDYTLQDGHTINKEEAKKDGGYLASLLQRLGGRRKRSTKGKRNGKGRQGTYSGRIAKTNRK
ncbi:hypothetical protein PWT90_04247 [Aphanocladium album]|nr:hypothetical protein PWT90_04247 [Aphanocladium album]